ncbi:MAG TPA: nucleotide exchange factor GrpE, partial [Eubacteriales bacterium]|jgi:molecular chaperone GrpE|nr:nucleotide exchange factor GrpE [Clostridia bacterium]HRR89954.1 nucleotide exchange factor GrpE [Eubacteriales bacterium]HRU84912.1 nucleotide exchange factor GrpE [Eubacteriales bacterium]
MAFDENENLAAENIGAQAESGESAAAVAPAEDPAPQAVSDEKENQTQASAEEELESSDDEDLDDSDDDEEYEEGEDCSLAKDPVECEIRQLTRQELKAAKKAEKLLKKQQKLINKEERKVDEEKVSEKTEELNKVIEELKAELERKNSELAKINKLARESQDKVIEVKVLAANLKNDFDNYKKRNAEVASQSREDGINKVLCELIPIVDNFDRAKAFITDAPSLEGFILMEQQFHCTLRKFGVEEIEALGCEFDMNTMNAVARVEDAENDGKVVDVIAKGYKRCDKILRHAVVRVGFAPAPVEAPSEAPADAESE